jgi:hypothetical protein
MYHPGMSMLTIRGDIIGSDKRDLNTCFSRQAGHAAN